MTYRFANLDDCRLLAELNHQLNQDEGSRSRRTLPELEQRMRKWLAREYRALIYEDGGEVVAYALYRDEAEEIHLRQLFVVPHRRQEGLGRRAVQILRGQVRPKNKKLIMDVVMTHKIASA